MKRGLFLICLGVLSIRIVTSCLSEPEASPTQPPTGIPVAVEWAPPATSAALEEPVPPPALESAPVGSERLPIQEPPSEESDASIAEHAFPPTLSDTEWHADPWRQQNCLRCHETGVGEAPAVVHRGMGALLLSARCRTCHVQIPGSQPREQLVAEEPESEAFAADAFPPMIPVSSSHRATWQANDCLLCHEDGTHGAPLLVHAGLPAVVRTAKCRTCHVQVRAIEAGLDKL